MKNIVKREEKEISSEIFDYFIDLDSAIQVMKNRIVAKTKESCRNFLFIGKYKCLQNYFFVTHNWYTLLFTTSTYTYIHLSFT